MRERKSRCLAEELCWMEVLFAEAAETERGVVWEKWGMMQALLNVIGCRTSSGMSTRIDYIALVLSGGTRGFEYS